MSRLVNLHMLKASCRNLSWRMQNQSARRFIMEQSEDYRRVWRSESDTLSVSSGKLAVSVNGNEAQYHLRC